MPQPSRPTPPDAPHRTAAQSRRCGDGKFSLGCAFRCAARGVAYAFTSQRNLKIQLTMGVAVVILGFAFGLSQAEWLAIALSITVVAVAEIINTAVESAVDLVTSEWHPLACTAKDTAAGAVLVAAAGSVAVGLIVFVPHLL